MPRILASDGIFEVAETLEEEDLAVDSLRINIALSMLSSSAGHKIPLYRGFSISRVRAQVVV